MNGFGGVDFLDADADGYRAGRRGAARDRRHGVPADVHHARRGAARSPRSREVPRAATGPRILGVHLEGPFLSARAARHAPAARRGAIPTRAARAPARGGPGAADDARARAARRARADRPAARARRHGLAAGTRDATAGEANAAFDRGVRTVTHIFNAMRPLAHRDPGIVGAALARRTSSSRSILDGVHLDPDTSALVWRAAAGGSRSSPTRSPAPAIGDGAYASASIEVERRGRRRPRRGRRARRQRPDDDRGRAQPHRARRAARGRARGGRRRPGARARAAQRRAARRRAARPTSSSSTTTLEIERVLVGGETRVAA